MTRSGALVPGCHPDVGCITCGDEGVAMRALKVDVVQRLAVCVDEAGSTSEVDLGLVAGVMPGDSLLVHAGVALTRLDVEAATPQSSDRAPLAAEGSR
jgi:hydrogenase maturation factor